jgi:hypothetical protein
VSVYYPTYECSHVSVSTKLFNQAPFNDVKLAQRNYLIEVDSIRLKVLTAMSMKMAVFWVVAPCSLVKVHQRFRGSCCLHHQGETLVNFYQTTRRYNPKYSHLRTHRRENLKSYKSLMFVLRVYRGDYVFEALI